MSFGQILKLGDDNAHTANGVAHQKLTGSLTIPAGQTVSLTAVQAASGACTTYPALAGITWQYKMAGLP